MTSRGPSGRLSPDQFVERLRDVVAANAEGNARLVTRFGDFFRNASQELRDARPGERTDAEALLTRWLEFNLASFSAVSSQGLALINDLLSAAEDTLPTRGPHGPDVPSTPASRVELRLSGRQGERVETGFVIENNFDRSLAVTLSPTDLVPASGVPLPAALVSFEPAKLAIEPRGQGVVQASVTITDDFAVGETYSMTIRLLGFEGKELGLSVTALPADAAKSARTRKTAAKRQSRATKPRARKAAKKTGEPPNKIRMSAKKTPKTAKKRKPRA